MAVSFPDLGKAPFDGSTPIIMYGPDCGKPLPKSPPPPALSAERAQTGLGDTPRVEVALPANVAGDPYLTNWVKTQPGPVTFDGTFSDEQMCHSDYPNLPLILAPFMTYLFPGEGKPCSFPGRVWKSKVGDYW